VNYVQYYGHTVDYHYLDERKKVTPYQIIHQISM